MPQPYHERIELVRDPGGWTWRFRAVNRKVVAVSSHFYNQRHRALEAALMMPDLALPLADEVKVGSGGAIIFALWHADTTGRAVDIVLEEVSR